MVKGCLFLIVLLWWGPYNLTVSINTFYLILSLILFYQDACKNLKVLESFEMVFIKSTRSSCEWQYHSMWLLEDGTLFFLLLYLCSVPFCTFCAKRLHCLFHVSLPVQGIDHNGPRVRHVPLQKSLAGLRGSLQSGDADRLSVSIVGPVQVFPNPVHGYSLNIVKFYNKIVQKTNHMVKRHCLNSSIAQSK